MGIGTFNIKNVAIKTQFATVKSTIYAGKILNTLQLAPNFKILNAIKILSGILTILIMSNVFRKRHSLSKASYSGLRLILFDDLNTKKPDNIYFSTLNS